jgi:hypothetical protein
LVEALLERQMPALMERRRRLLDALDARPEPATSRDVLSALMRPPVELLAGGGDSALRYLRLIHRLQADGDLDPRFVIERWPGGVDRLVPLLREANPSLPVAVIRLRLELAIDVMLRSLAHGPAFAGGGLDPESNTQEMLAYLDRMTEARQRQLDVE